MFQQESDGLESERDHRRLGRELELFSFEDAVGPGLALWHPKGGLVRHLLEDYWRKEQIAHGYQLVYSPHVGRSVLWETSGHLDFYRDSMFPPIEADDLNLPRRFGLSYVGPDGAAHRPFVLHRAIFGSLELLRHPGGALRRCVSILARPGAGAGASRRRASLRESTGGGLEAPGREASRRARLPRRASFGPGPGLRAREGPVSAGDRRPRDRRGNGIRTAPGKLGAARAAPFRVDRSATRPSGPHDEPPLAKRLKKLSAFQLGRVSRFAISRSAFATSRLNAAAASRSTG